MNAPKRPDSWDLARQMLDPAGDLYKAGSVSDHDVEALLAKAPAMARLLLSLQWKGLTYGDSEPCCPSCSENEPNGHRADCELAAVLRAAGMLP